MMNHIWLFRFTSYSYCQGTRDRYTEDLRLVKCTLPCEEWEATNLLIKELEKEGTEYDKKSITSLTFNVTNS